MTKPTQTLESNNDKRTRERPLHRLVQQGAGYLPCPSHGEHLRRRQVSVAPHTTRRDRPPGATSVSGSGECDGTLRKYDGTIDLWVGTPAVLVNSDGSVICKLKNRSAPHFKLILSLAEFTGLIEDVHRTMYKLMQIYHNNYVAKLKECSQLRAQIKELKQK